MQNTYAILRGSPRLRLRRVLGWAVVSAACLATDMPAARAQLYGSSEPQTEATIARPTPGGQRAHRFYAGWPSLGYEWRTGVAPQYAWSGEVVYGPWAGAFVDTDLGVAGQLDVRRWTARRGRLDLGWSLGPGLLLGSTERRGDDRFLAGVRGQPALLARVRLHPSAWLNTGIASPITLFAGEDLSDLVVPVYPRLGFDVAAARELAVSLLAEVGPAFRLFENPESELGARAALSLTF
jgi:hypothetical protein